VPSRFSEQLFAAARQPKRLLLVPGATHNNSMALGGQNYRKAIDALMQTRPAARVAGAAVQKNPRDS